MSTYRVPVNFSAPVRTTSGDTDTISVTYSVQDWDITKDWALRVYNVEFHFTYTDRWGGNERTFVQTHAQPDRFEARTAINRRQWWPFTGSVLRRCRIKIHARGSLTDSAKGRNSDKDRDNDVDASTVVWFDGYTYVYFEAPAAPTSGDVAFDAEAASLSLSVKSPNVPSTGTADQVSYTEGYNAQLYNAAGSQYHNHGLISYDQHVTKDRERARTGVELLREGVVHGRREAQSVVVSTTSEAEEYSRSVAVANAKDLWQGDWVTYTLRAWADGKGGRSAEVRGSRTFSWPAQPQVASVGRQGAPESSGKAVVLFSTNSSAQHPVDSVVLQRLRSTAAATAREAALASDATWEDVQGSGGGASATGATDDLASCWPATGRRTWFRVRAAHDSYVTYSTPVDLGVWEDPSTAIEGAPEVLSCLPGDDGTSAVVSLGWESAADDVAVEWSSHRDAWSSTEAPDSHAVTWDEGAVEGEGGGRLFAHSATLTIRGLSTGVTYYVRARLHATDMTGSDVYSAYAPTATVLAASKPRSVVLHAPNAVTRGSDVELWWSVDADEVQSGWVLYDGTGMVWARGLDGSSAATVPAEALEGLDSASFAVMVTTGGEWVTSADVTVVDPETWEATEVHDAYAEVVIADPPSCSVSVAETLGSQPVVATVSTDSPDTSVALSVRAAGATRTLPTGTETQEAGRTVWAGSTRPAWREDGEGGFTAEVGLPADLALWDGASYVVAATATDAGTGLSSGEAKAILAVAWEHQAQPPAAAVEADAAGLSAVVTVTAPEGAADGDEYDLYRSSGGRVRLVASGLSDGDSVEDRWPAFSGPGWEGARTFYRAATRTADGDVAWADFDYSLACGEMVLDWEGGTLSAPYDVSASSGWSKGFEARRHLDGGVEGYWDGTVAMTATASTQLVRVGDEGGLSAARGLARHDGPVMVRLPDGSAYPADVQVTGESMSQASGTVGLTLSITEVDTAREFDATPVAATQAGGDEGEEEGGGS